MVDYTVLGVAALGVLGTLGAGLIGFAGPSWNEQRIQLARDKRDARKALRLIGFEIFDLTIPLRQLSEEVEHADRMRTVQLIIARLPNETSEWHRHKDEFALLVTDQTGWRLVAAFYSVLSQFAAFTEDTTPELLEPLMTQLPRILEVSETAQAHLASLLADDQ
jgi:hypothetical protein